MIAVAQPGRVASQREVARRLGVSHTALQKAQRAGRIAPESDGAWDVEKVRARLADSSDPVRKTATLAQPTPAAPRPVSPPIAAPAPDPLPRAAQNTFPRCAHGERGAEGAGAQAAAR
ncbi:hypothetical protein [Falsiroseomonas oryzae]|uniref:hypothetical protein n=1 Tax=Falsiroseomonas oryzae TaxID=2766473 RepID=UPI0022EA7DBB|nr:hypothetical protein [Roseomonas sp. MO-31]